MRRRALIAAGLGLVLAGTLVPAHAAPPRSFTRTATFVDDSPDPTAFVLGPEHCKGRLPAEPAVVVAVPGPGNVNVAISGFQGEWSLMITDPAGDVITTADTDPPETESLTLRVRKAAKIHILPCNIAGTFEAKLTYSYKYKK